MKNLLLAVFSSLLFFLSPDVIAQGHWNKLPSPTDQLLRHLFFINDSTGWVIGRDGLIIRTTDGGDTWTEQNSTVQTFIISIFFINENLGWALTIKDTQPFGTIILSTSNGGDMWMAEDYPEINVFMNTVFFLDSLNGFLGGSKIVKTSNGGMNWVDVNVDSNMISALPVFKFKFFSPQFGYACGGFIDLAGVIWRTTDYGANWTPTGVSPDQVFDIFILDSLNAVTLSGDPEGFYGVGKINTTDAGETWSYEQLPIFALSFSIDFRTSTDGWSASGYKFLFTPDRGSTWNEVSTPYNSIIYDLTFTDNHTGYAVGDDGIILKYSPDSADVNNVSCPQAIARFLLNQNYPNPFNPSTNISYQILSADFVSLIVYDMLGNEVTTLVNKELPPGKYEVEFNAANLVGGIYLYQLRAGNYTETKKMVLLK